MDASKSFHDRMSTVLDAITASCPPSRERKRPAEEEDGNDVLYEEVHSYAPPTQRKYSSQHRDRSQAVQTNGEESSRRSSPQHRDRSRAAQMNRGEGNRHREPRRFLVPSKPGYAINPSKWTKYNLVDDGTKGLIRSGMSDDQVNKHAALEFLKKRKELRKESSEGNEEQEEEEIGGKMVFKKPVMERVRGRCERVDKKGGGLGAGAGVYAMPEYKVGGKEEEVKRGRRRKQLLVLGQRLVKTENEEEEEDMEKSEKVRTMGEKKGRQGVCLGHLEQEEGEI